ncbi:Inactive peptidyl-prolyl cis-trans isomerase fkbp6 [Bulinus truncatus]|nr:Inactive peptidyl-prolyl cis-trans isomerase fkbp6 [Bulinus truncatus]
MSRFLIQPDYAYGEMGCPPRIPPKAKLIMDVEVLNFTEQDGVDDYYDLSPEERRTKLKFADIEKVVNAETAEAKQYFDNKNYQKAALKYGHAQSILDDYHLKDENEQKLWIKQCLRVFLNLAICHHHLRHYGRAIHFCNEVLEKDKNNVKALYFKGKALLGLCKFTDAKESLKRARTLEPSNTTIANALQTLAKSMKEHELFEKNMCQKMFSKPLSDLTTSTEKKESYKDVEQCSKEFRNLVEQQLLKFQKDSDMTEMPFPSIHMTEVEIACILETAEKLGMDIKKRGTGSQIRYEVHKKSVKPEGFQ